MTNGPELAERAETVTHLLEAAKAINSNRDLASVLTEVMRAAEKLVDADAASLLLADEETGDRVFSVALGDKGDKLSQTHVPRGHGVAGWVGEHGQPLNVPDVRVDPRFAGVFDRQTGYQTRSLLAVPVIQKDKLVGVLEVLNKVSAPAFSEADQRVLSLLADQTAVAIENARLFEALRETNANLEQTVSERTAELTTSNAFLSAVLGSVNDGIAVLSSDLEVLWINEVMETWLGSAEPDRDSHCFQRFHGRDTPCEDCPAARTLTSRAVERLTGVMWGGPTASRYCEVLAAPMFDEHGQVEQVLLTVHDLTERKALEEAETKGARLAMLSEVVTSVNHEINNPLTSILGNAQLLRERLTPANAKEAQRLESIAEAAQRISVVTRKLAEVADPSSRAYVGGVRMLVLGGEAPRA
ncbi:MAG: hypothetical protein AUJ96_27865 [Armatimonadetes bacterium CG2_30_66_41]|nr:MAG: hypothetical protein AUJ96_27865 [Armatimonadetes bacterium CG2_30_66_41]